jgi:hypothetical protein
VPDLVLAPELAPIALLGHALDVTVTALLAEHPTLTDDYAMARDGDPVVSLAAAICRRAVSLEDTLGRYTRAVRAAATALAADDDVDADLPF